ncbi:MAG: polysaccharide biosynthesis C-terminal domain-containing protein [Bacteroidota bacterium]
MQKFIPQFKKNKILCKQILTSSLLISIAFALLGVSVFYIIKEVPGRIMANSLLTKGFAYIIPGIGFLTINKILLSFLNGMRFMKTYAVFSTSRPVLMLIFTLFFIVLETNVKYLGLIFSLPEFLLTLLLIFNVRNWFTVLTFPRFRKLLALQFWYGNRVVLGSIVTNFQSKVDIFILGFFVSNTMLGVYSFAVFVADGFFQIFYVFRTNVNPIVTNIFYNRSGLLLKRIVSKSIRSFYKIFLWLGLIIAVLYPILLIIFRIENYIFHNLSVFYILLSGILIASGYIPFQFFFNQIGRPKEQTRFLVLLFCFTISLNLALIPFFGIYGAAIAIFSANIFQMIYLRKGLKQINSLR